MEEVWLKLVYDGVDAGDRYEYNLGGDIRFVDSKKLIRQKGNMVTLSIEGDPWKISRSKLLGKKFNPKIRSDKGISRKDAMLKTIKDELLEKLMAEVDRKMELKILLALSKKGFGVQK